MTELAEMLKDPRLRDHFERNRRSYEGRTQAAVVSELQSIRDGDPSEILYAQWRAYSGIDADRPGDAA